MDIFLNEPSASASPYHFPVYDINGQPSNVVIIRNLTFQFNLVSPFGSELKTLIQSISPFDSIEEPSYGTVRYGVVIFTLSSSDAAKAVAKAMDGTEFDGNVYITFQHGVGPSSVSGVRN